MNLYAEVLDLQERWGITYKDSSHWLYMAKLEKLKVVETSYKAFTNMDQWLDDYLKNLSKQFGPISIGADIIPSPNVVASPNFGTNPSLSTLWFSFFYSSTLLQGLWIVIIDKPWSAYSKHWHQYWDILTLASSYTWMYIKLINITLRKYQALQFAPTFSTSALTLFPPFTY